MPSLEIQPSLSLLLISPWLTRDSIRILSFGLALQDYSSLLLIKDYRKDGKESEAKFFYLY
jgi:hypothetical protein